MESAAVRRHLPGVEAILDGLLRDVVHIAAAVLDPIRAPAPHDVPAPAASGGAPAIGSAPEGAVEGAVDGVSPPAAVHDPVPRRLVRHSGHTIGYGTGAMRETALRLHVDDSLLTVNVCLGRPGFTGSSLLFTGAQAVCLPQVARMQARRDLVRRLSEVEVAAVPKPGWALLHLGAHPHRTLPIQSGERFNWVLWFHEAKAKVSS